jgi:glycosyltransferase involved in cell wall biosynthesis
MKIHQFSAGFNQGDAISNLMIYYKNKFNSLKISCELYSQNIGHNTGKICKKYNTYNYSDGDIIIYHHSIHSKVLDFIKSIEKKSKKIILYHNVTPSKYIEPYDLTLSYYLKKGREELKDIGDYFSINLAVSNFNKKELDTLGFSNVDVLPISLDLSNYTKLPKSNTDYFNILFVGRIAPNKKQCDLIKICKVLSNYNFPFKLTLAGKNAPELSSYKSELDNLIKYFNLGEKIEFLEFIDQNKLAELYSSADLFLCMSEHEGFCVPLVEAMYYDIPIIAYNSSAISETLGNGGFLINEKRFEYIAELIFKIYNSSKLQDYLKNKAKNRFEELNSHDNFKKLFSLVN